VKYSDLIYRIFTCLFDFFLQFFYICATSDSSWQQFKCRSILFDTINYN